MIRDVNEKDFKTLKNIPFAPAYRHTLVSVNSGFRTEKPVCSKEKCNGCFLCYLYCPDGVIKKDGESISIDYDYCKGCGICQKICRKDAIHMEKER
jgi:2-oxoacid:acceptor oxidoreductase delta subunit (pyruvate/2-ketoisovalerate family)